MKYEYKLMQTEAPTASEDQLTDNFGDDGWMLTQVYSYDGAWYYVFVRPRLAS